MGLNWVEGLSAGLGNFMRGYAHGQELHEKKTSQARQAEHEAAQVADAQQKAQQYWAVDLPDKVAGSMGLGPQGRQVMGRFLTEGQGDYDAALSAFEQAWPVEKEKLLAGGGAAGGAIGALGGADGEDSDLKKAMANWESAGVALRGLSQFRKSSMQRGGVAAPAGPMGPGGAQPQGTPGASQAQPQAAPGAPRMPESSPGGSAALPQRQAAAVNPMGGPPSTQMSSGTTNAYQGVLGLLDMLSKPDTPPEAVKRIRYILAHMIPTGTGHTAATR